MTNAIKVVLNYRETDVAAAISTFAQVAYRKKQQNDSEPSVSAIDMFRFDYWLTSEAFDKRPDVRVLFVWEQKLVNDFILKFILIIRSNL